MSKTESIRSRICFRDLVDDRVDEGVFRVDRSIYTDKTVFEAEIERIFEGGWVFLCHESQVEKPGDYFATEIGRQPVFVMRQQDGALGCFINACSHRGAVLTPLKQGTANVLTCRFHGWVYDRGGRCVSIKNEDAGYPAADRSDGRFDLRWIGALDSYKGFVFGSLRSDVPALQDHLGAAARWIDLLADQAQNGLEVVPGCSTYVVHGNWKLQAENSVDGYHVTTLHSVFAATTAQREARDATPGMGRTESGRIRGKVPSGTYDLGNGHMGLWALHTTPHVRPIYEARAWLEENLKPVEVDWILNRGRNLCLFPNLMLMDNPSTQIRLVKPVSAGFDRGLGLLHRPQGREPGGAGRAPQEVRGLLPYRRNGDVGRCRRARSRPGRLSWTAKPVERHDPRPVRPGCRPRPGRPRPGLRAGGVLPRLGARRNVPRFLPRLAGSS